MRVRTITAAFLFGMPAWAAAQDVVGSSRPSMGREAYELFSSFYDYDRDIPLEARIGGRFEIPGATVEKVVFRSRDSDVVAFLATPKEGAKPYPCVLALHGLGLDKMSWWEDDNDLSGGNLTKALLGAGIAVLTPDAQYHGERSHSNDYEFTHSLRMSGREFRFRDMLIQSVVDCRRAIDYLATRSNIDESKIGVIGYSLGGDRDVCADGPGQTRQSGGCMCDPN
jgi:dipeptidyl aminopeptidase/acylaminoacyl peptidase